MANAHTQLAERQQLADQQSRKRKPTPRPQPWVAYVWIIQDNISYRSKVHKSYRDGLNALIACVQEVRKTITDELQALSEEGEIDTDLESLNEGYGLFIEWLEKTRRNKRKGFEIRENLGVYRFVLEPALFLENK